MITPTMTRRKRRKELEAARADTQQARFDAFCEATHPYVRDWIAFLDFEQAIDRAVTCATMMNPYDNDPGYNQEHASVKLALSEMLYRVLPRVDLGSLSADGRGHRLRASLRDHRTQARCARRNKGHKGVSSVG
jgi:hypothetical protein